MDKKAEVYTDGACSGNPGPGGWGATIKINEETVVELSDYSKRQEEIAVDLEKQEIYFGNKVVKFKIDEFKKKCLINGLDDIALSMEKIKQIDDYEKKINTSKPWISRNETN